MKWITGDRNKGIYAEVYEDIYTDVSTNISTTHYRLDVWRDGVGVEDQLQDSFEITLRCALEDYDIPLDAWKQVE